MEREKLINAMAKHTFNMFADKWYENVVDNILREIEMKEKAGYVYFIKYYASNSIKIGKSINILNRLSQLKTGFSDDIFLIGYIYTQDYNDLEKTLHNKYINSRVSGEWFDIDVSLCLDTINKHNGIVVNSKYDKKLLIDDGILISCSNIKKEGALKDSILIGIFNNLEKDVKYTTNHILDLIPDVLKDNYTKKRITLSLKKYAEKRNYKYFSGNSNSQRWFMFY